MDAAGMGSPFGDFIHPSDGDHMRNILATDDTSQSSVCSLCRSSYVPDGDLDSRTICSDCKFLLAENLVNPVHESRGRAHGGRRIGRRRTRYNSSESTSGDFSRQFSEMMSRIRHSQSTTHGDHYSDWETNIRLSQNTSSHSTPSNSRRWVMANSDAESSGFDNGDSFYGESESSVSFSRHRGLNGDGETISFSAYGWDSDNSVDGHYTMDSEMHFPPGDGSDIESDTDIDPMHAGINQWRLDLQGEDEAEGDEDDEEDEWEEESDGEEESADSVDVVGSQLASPLVSPAPAANNSSDLYQLTVFPEIDGMIRWSIREGRGSDTAGYTLPYLDELELPSNVVNSWDYLDSGSFEDLLEYLAENDTSRRGAPPASVSFVNSLPLVVIDEVTVKCDSAITCAICKDIFVIGNKVNRLPCCHLYHPSCILPWLSTRNSCPLCRYELPTDDKDYEAEKQENNQSMRGNRENGWQGLVEDDFTEGGEGEEPDLSRQISEQTEGLEETFSVRGERHRGRWLVLAAAPIVSIMGIALVLFLGNPLGRGRAHNIGLSSQRMRHSGGFGSSGTNRTDCKTFVVAPLILS